MRTYDNYKESGIEWIGEIPGHWVITKLKFETQNFDGKRIPLSSEIRADKGGSIPYYGATGIIDYIDEFIFDGEFLLVGEDGAPFFERDRAVAFIAINKFWVNNHCHILSCNMNNDIRFMTFFLNVVDYVNYINGSTRDKLTQSQLSNISIISLSKEEQTAIANYLDSKTTEIDQVVADKEALVSLYEEEKKALINEAVTKGLNANVKLKPSGIDWLGEIPEHWEVKKLKYILSIRSGESIGTDDVSDEFRIPVYGGNGIMGYTYKSNSIGKELIIGRVGAYCGNIYISEDEKWISDNALRVQSFQNWEFTYHFLKALDLNKYASQNAQPLITGTLVKDQYIPLPPLEEQTAIVRYIESETANINDKINQIKQEIDLLKEYRQALIFEAVTGKIQV